MTEPALDPALLLAETRSVRALARALVGDRHQAEDLAQEAVLASLDPALAPREPSARRQWLRGVVRNLARMQRRGARRRQRREQRDGERADAPAALDVVAEAERRQQVVAAALELAEPYRSTVLLRYLREQSVAEVARQTGASPEAVRVRCHRGLSTLREKLQQRWGVDWRHALFALALPARPAAGLTVHTILWSLGMKTSIKFVLAAATLLLAWMVWPEGAADVPAVPPVQEEATTEGAPSQVVDAEAGAPLERAPLAAVTPPVDGAELRPVDPRTILGGVVVDTEGGPVPGVEVLLLPYRITAGRLRASDPAAGTQAITDGAGRFGFPGLTPSLDYGLAVRAEGYAPVLHQSVPGTVEITLQEQGGLTGRVFDDRQRPLAGVSVAVRLPRWEDGGIASVTEAVTDAEGRYSLLELPQTRLQVEVSAPGWTPVIHGVDLDAAWVEHDVRLASLATLEARVVDSVTGVPVAGARVHCRGRDRRHLAHSDTAGMVQMQLGREPVEDGLRRVKSGRRDWDFVDPDVVVVVADGYCQTIQPLSDLDRDTVAEIQLLPAAGLRGRVVDAEGEPVVGARLDWLTAPTLLLANGAWAEPAVDSETGQTDAEGFFHMPRLPWGVDHAVLAARHEGEFERHFDAAPRFQGEERALEIVLGAGHSLSGRTHVNGEPSACYVRLDRSDDGEDRRMERTEDDGQFTLHGLRPGEYAVSFCTGDGTAIWSDPQSILIPHDGLLDLHLQVALDQITGVVRDDAGAPQAGVNVFAIRQGAERNPSGFRTIAGSAVTDDDGRFAVSLPPNPEARYVLKVAAGSLLLERRDLAGGDQGIELVLPETAVVPLRFETEAGEPVSSVQLRCRRDGGEWMRSLGGSDAPTEHGVLRLKLPVGPLEIEAWSTSQGLVRTRQRVMVRAGGESEVLVRLRPE